MRRNSFALSLILAISIIDIHAKSAGAQTAPLNTAARQLFSEGRDLFDDGKFAEAERRFRDALVKYPKADKSDQTAYYLIKSLVKLGRVQDARAEMDNFRRNYPTSKWNEDLREVSIELDPEAKMQIERLVSQNRGSTDLPPNASIQALKLRYMILLEPEHGIENARDLLMIDPSDPAVIANLGTIYMSKSPQALPFLMDLSMSAAVSPNLRENAFFWASRKNPDKEQVAQDLMDRLKKKENEPLVSEALFRMTFGEHREVLEHIVLSSDPNKFSAIEKIYRGGSITLRTDLVGFVAKLSDPQAFKFVMEVAQHDKDATVRNAAIQALGNRKDMSDVKTIDEMLKSVPLSPVATPPPVRSTAPAIAPRKFSE